ncbi:hypothetical protein MNBD_GAMMA22-2837 [hydrothermal vent metagenome]|uniref:Uncharacterized protein n=1 Tax=hydrothermal vent metagenome TaxID=652676 RepID=A0A3B1B6G7_9ZZZZ
MSNNAVFCISDNTKTIRLTVYRCKPNIFLKQLTQSLNALDDLNVDNIVMYFLDNGFELDAETSSSFKPVNMCTPLLVNWAWLLDFESKILYYWDVTAALNGMQQTIEQSSISPMDYSEWIASEAVTDYQTQVKNSQSELHNVGITIAKF